LTQGACATFFITTDDEANVQIMVLVPLLLNSSCTATPSTVFIQLIKGGRTPRIDILKIPGRGNACDDGYILSLGQHFKSAD